MLKKQEYIKLPPASKEVYGRAKRIVDEAPPELRKGLRSWVRLLFTAEVGKYSSPFTPPTSWEEIIKKNRRVIDFSARVLYGNVDRKSPMPILKAIKKWTLTSRTIDGYRPEALVDLHKATTPHLDGLITTSEGIKPGNTAAFREHMQANLFLTAAMLYFTQMVRKHK
ncbi:MAG: hypothetical protein V1835_05530 [Candidatus Micrarchaeota archaeon]